MNIVNYIHKIDATCYEDYYCYLYIEYNNKKYMIFDYDILDSNANY